MLYPALPPRLAAVMIWLDTGNPVATVARLRNCATPSRATRRVLAAWASGNGDAFARAMDALEHEIAMEN